MGAALRLLAVWLWASSVLVACGAGEELRDLDSETRTGTLRVGAHDVRIRNGTPELQSLVAWALDRFAKAGLPVPTPRSVTFSPYARDRCHGYAGLTTGPGLRDITLCFGTADACPQASCPPWSARARALVLHELAHTWLSQHLDAQRRDRFLDAVRMSWWRADARWDQRGVERAAETLVWALDDQTRTPTGFGDPAPEELARHYAVLTGRPPP